MGLFSGKTKIYVASSVYNLAGDIAQRPNYMKTVVIGNIVSNTGFTMADTIQSSYLNGPGIRMRLFSSWSKDHYDDKVGMAASSLGVLAKVDPDVVASQLPTQADSTTLVQSAEIGFADFEYWCDQYLYENYPERIMERFEIDIDEETNEITMISQDGGTDISFFPENFVPGALYLYVDYSYYKQPTVEPPVVKPEDTYSTEDDLPSTFLWTTVSETDTPETTSLTTTTKVTKSYSDGRPDEVTTTPVTTTQNWTSWVNVYKRGFTLNPDGTTVILDNRIMTQSKRGKVEQETTTDTQTEVVDGVTITTTTEVTEDVLVNYYVSQTTSNNTVMTAAGDAHMFIYKRGDGNAVLDALFDTPASDNRFYPFIPIRNDKRWVENDPIYPDCKKAMRKATGSKLDEVVKELKKNDKIGDIQYIYGTFGCSLNAPEDTAKEYIYRFFQMATEAFPPDPQYPTLEAVIAGFAQANEDAEAYYLWWKEGNHSAGNPPAPPQYPVIPKRTFRVSSDKVYKYDMTIEWNCVFETTHTGQAWAGAKQSQLRTRYAGDVQLTRKNFRRDNETGQLVSTNTVYNMQEYEMLWQDGKDTYRRLRVLGLHHNNRVYKNKSVGIDVAEAMGDAEESGFIIPLHTNIYRSMSLTHSTQLATACSYLVMNSYKKVKQKWYQTGAFKVVVIVVAVVVSVFTAGAGGAGILGAYGAVGAALGFAGLAAVIVGAVANAIAAMVLISILQLASTQLFGDKIGFIVAAIASVVAMNVGTAMATGTSMSTMAANMMNAQNIMQLTSAVGNGITQYINASTADIIRQAEQTMQQYNTDMLAVNKKYEEMFGTDGLGVIDPMQFVSIESLDTFLSRTTLTGSDIAGMSLDMITNFSDMTLDLTLKD